MEIRVLDASVTAHILEFASDGESILFSSGVADDAAPDAAPDLWRFTPGPSAEPELIWRNPRRDHSIVKLGGDLGMAAFVDIPLDGSRAWDLWVLPRHSSEPILLASHPGDEEISSLVPSFSMFESQIVWTEFARGPEGAVSRLVAARDPDWQPEVIAERNADEAELWLPSLYGSQLAFTEVVYADDRSTDERHVYLMNLGEDSSLARRLDTSGLATMPLSSDHAVLWKEADRGFNMFNWGRMFLHDLETGETRPLGLRPQEYVNYPSAGSRFVAWWGADSTQFGVYDLVRGAPRLIERHASDGDISILRPHIAGDLLVWVEVDRSKPDGENAVLRYSYMPLVKELAP